VLECAETLMDLVGLIGTLEVHYKLPDLQVELNIIVNVEEHATLKEQIVKHVLELDVLQTFHDKYGEPILAKESQTLFLGGQEGQKDHKDGLDNPADLLLRQITEIHCMVGNMHDSCEEFNLIDGGNIFIRWILIELSPYLNEILQNRQQNAFELFGEFELLGLLACFCGLDIVIEDLDGL
jgi:hypothetical protein